MQTRLGRLQEGGEIPFPEKGENERELFIGCIIDFPPVSPFLFYVGLRKYQTFPIIGVLLQQVGLDFQFVTNAFVLLCLPKWSNFCDTCQDRKSVV